MILNFNPELVIDLDKKYLENLGRIVPMGDFMFRKEALIHGGYHDDADPL